jgi:hypothetical protein
LGAFKFGSDEPRLSPGGFPPAVVSLLTNNPFIKGDPRGGRFGVDSVVEGCTLRKLRGEAMVFIRRRGRKYYLVHNVRRRGRVRQLHLARLGDRPRVTDEIVRQVGRSYPLLELDWDGLRERIQTRIELFGPDSAYLDELVEDLRGLNLDLAELSPPVVRVSRHPAALRELVTLLRLLRSTVEIKLKQFRQASPAAVSTRREFSAGD